MSVFVSDFHKQLSILHRSAECVALTIRDKVLRHVEGNLDSEGAGILRSIDNGNDTRADGDQRQGDLI